MQTRAIPAKPFLFARRVLFCKLSAIVGSDDFIEMQDKLLRELTDKSSQEAKKILKRIIDFYKNNNQFDKAFDVIKSNLQIESFREELTKKLIAENKLQEAKNETPIGSTLRLRKYCRLKNIMKD